MVKFVDEYVTVVVPGDENICKPERPAWNLSAVELSASVIGVGRRVLTSVVSDDLYRV